MSDLEDKVKELGKKAAETHDSGDAMRFSQAAVNLAQAIITLATVKREARDAAS